MPRKGAVPKRDVLPDPVYGNKTVKIGRASCRERV